MENMIDITGVDIVELVQHAYDLSQPQGLGHLHFTPEPLSDDEAKSLITPNDRVVVNLDYIKGRACKFTVFQQDGGLFIPNSWYDHTEEQLNELLNRVGISRR